jgi:hypothetical protein
VTEPSVLSPLDLVSAKLHRPSRPLDFSVILTLEPGAVQWEMLQAGAISATHLFPTSGSRVVSRSWQWENTDPFDTYEAEDLPSAERAIHDFVNGGKDPHSDIQVRQLLVTVRSSDEVTLVSRFHHCAFDGVSAALWIFHQMMVASGEVESESSLGLWDGPELRTHEDHHRKSAFSHVGASRRVWSPSTKATPVRDWHSWTLDSSHHAVVKQKVEGITTNDILSASILQTMVDWNIAHGVHSNKMGLWVPMNIRRQAFVGFGNGSSRIRIYADKMHAETPAERYQKIREQVMWSKDNGEWHVPTDSPILGLSDAFMVPILRAFLGRPWVDMASAPFTHLEDLGLASRFVPMVRSASWVIMLHERFPFGITAASVGPDTQFTMTYDPGMISREHVFEFERMFSERVRTDREEIIG